MTTASDARTVPLSLKESAEYLLEECRMVLPGIQALFGFQLVAVFSTDFRKDLDPTMQRLHLMAIGLIACAVALIMAPAAFHRQAGGRRVTDTFVKVSTRLLLWSMVPLAVGICIDFYLIATIMLSGTLAALAAAILFLLYLVLWIALPRVRALQRLMS